MDKRKSRWPTGTLEQCPSFLARGGWVTIPACIAGRHILLHIIDLSAVHVIVRLAFVEVKTREVFQLLQLKWQVFAAFVGRMFR